MKKILIFLLILSIVFSSFISFAADGDIIHTGLKRIYRVKTSDITNDLMNDVMNNISNLGFLGQYYREKTIDGVLRYVNVVDEETAHLSYLSSLVANPADLENYIKNNLVTVAAGLEAKTVATAKVFGDIDDLNKGKIEDYTGSSDARRLKSPENYSTPVQGLGDNTTRIMKLTRPSGISATKWVYLLINSPVHLKPNDIVDGETYVEKADIPLSEGKYILLCATDRDNKVKAYTNILVLADMIKKPRVPVALDTSIIANFAKGTNKSGATVISGLPEGNWKIAVLPTPVDVVYEDSKFADSVNYVNGMEFVVANDAEVDSMTADFNKDIIIYSERDKLVDKYRIFNLTTNEVSGALDAEKTLVFTPSKGLISGNTVVAELDLPLNASKFMYALVGDNTIKPKLDRVFVGSVDYVIGNDIPVGGHKYLMLLATDDGGKVKAYGVVELLSTMIKDPLADELKELTNYSMPDKGNVVGTTGFQFLNYDGASLYYELSDKPIATPEKDSILPGKSKPIVNKDAVEIFVGTDPKLKDEKGFTLYMNLYAVIGGKVVAATWQNFLITPDNVNLPEAIQLPWSNYKDLHSAEALKPGASSDSTILKKLNKDGILNAVNLKYVYTFVDAETFVGINEVVRNTKSLEAGKELLQAKVGKWLLVLLVDSSNRTKYYTNIELTNDNTRTSDAKRLILGTNYSNPEPGTVFESTKFNLLGFSGIEDADKFMIKASDAPFKAVALNSKVEGAAPYAHVVDGIVNYILSPGKTDASGNILGVDIKDNRYLLLIATDNDGNVKGYVNLTLNENTIRGKKAAALTPTNFTLGKGVKPGTVKFNRLSPFGLSNLGWMYKWSPLDVFTANPPFAGQIVLDALSVRTKVLDQYSFEGVDDIKVGDVDHGYILLLAVNGNKAVGYTVISVKAGDVQSTADILDIQLNPGSNPDSTLIGGTDIAKAKKYIVSTTEMEKPGPNSDLPRAGVKDLLTSKEISVKIGEYLRIFNVDENNKVIGFRDFIIESSNIQQGTALLRILNPDGGVGSLEILEGKIRANAIKIQVELTGAKWADVVNDPIIKGLLLDGFESRGNEQGEWNKVIQKIKDGRFSISKSGETLTITTTATGDYNISVEQKINLTIPPKAIIGAINPIIASGEIVIRPTIDAKLSGSIVNNIRQTAINSGTAHIIIDIIDSPWIDTIDAVANKNILLNGFSGGVQWNALKSKIGMENIKLIDPQRISITIPKNEITINTPETIALTIDESLVEKAESDIIAAPFFTIYPNILPVKVGDIGSTVALESPKYVNALAGEDIWIIDLDGTSFKEDFAVAKDISTSTLPSGLKLDIIKVTNKQLSIKLTGKATQEINNGFINLVIKASAIVEKNYSDSNPIQLIYKQGNKINLDDVLYEIKDDGIYLVIDHDKDKLQYSTNSTTGANGTWDKTPSNDMVSMVLQPITIYVREAKQPGNFILVGKLVNPPAPTGIVIDKYDYSSGLKVRLNESTDLQYSLGTPNTWVDVDGEIPLAKDSVLVVRKKGLPGIGGDGYLPSLATPKLNGLYLGEVELDVTDSKIVGATTAMQYSLNSDDNGNGGSWNTVKTSDPVISFTKDNIVWIREGNSETNKMKLGKVGQADNLPEGFNLVGYDIGAKTLTNNSDIDLQYSINNGKWYNLDNGILDNVNFVPGTIEVRRRAAGNELPSVAIIIGEIALPIDPPEIKFDNDKKTIKYLDRGEFKTLDDLFEYKLDAAGSYQNGTNFNSDDGKNGDVTVFVRKKSDLNRVPSKEVSFKFTKNISFKDLSVNVAGGYIDGTTILMQYSTDSTNGLDGSWTIANAGKTDISFLEGMSLWIREKDKPSTSIPKVTNLSRMAALVSDWKLEYNILNKTIFNNSPIHLEYKIGEGSWTRIDAGVTSQVEFIAGDFEFRTRSTMDKLESITKLRATIMAPLSKSSITYSDVSNKILSINSITREGDWKDYQYRLKGTTTWANANLLKTLDLSGDKIIEIRSTATPTVLASQISEIKFIKNLNLGSVALSKYVSPLELNGTSVDMEYKVFFEGMASPTNWTKCSLNNTVLTGVNDINKVKLIIIRDGRVNNSDSERIIYPENGVGPVDLSVVSYVIQNNSIMFTGLNDNMDYKIGEDKTWISGMNFNLSDLSPVKLYVRDKNIQNLYRLISIDAPSAPIGVSVETISYDGTGAIVTLKGFDSKMEYSKDNGSNWSSNSPIILDASSDLIVRHKTVPGMEGIGKLPSLSTPKLNGLYLGNIGLDIGQGSINNTNSSMEYSLNSTDGLNGNWTVAGDGSTAIVFEANMNIWIRENSSKINKRKIGPISEFSFTEASLDKVIYNIKDKTVYNGTDSTLEYRFDNGNWKTILKKTTDEQVEFILGKFEVRKKGSANSLPSKPLVKATIGDNSMVLRVRSNTNPSDPSKNKIEFANHDYIWRNIDNLFEYKVGSNGTWVSGDTFPIDLGPSNVVFVRKLGTATTLPSKETTIYFNTTGKWVGGELNVSEGKIMDTTIDMEYSLNSTDGLDGKWTVASDVFTSVVFTPGMNVWLREKGKPYTYCLNIFNLEREAEPSLINLSYDILTKKIINGSNQNLEFRVGGGDWTKIAANTNAYEVDFNSGKLEFRKVAGYVTLPSNPVEMAIIKAAASGPIVVFDDINNKVVSINSSEFGWSLYEYRIGTGRWIPAELLATEDLVGNKTIDIRKKATSSTLASQVTQVKFTADLPLKSVKLSTHTTPFELNGTTGEMEYMIYYNDGTVPTVWTKCSPVNTKIIGLTSLENIDKILVRDSKPSQQTNQIQVY